MTLDNHLSDIAIQRRIHYSLDDVEKVYRRLGCPGEHLKSIHIAGTNGKGSTADLIAQGLEVNGYRVGLFTSPHLRSYTERIQINGKSVSERRLTELLRQVERSARGISLTEFELLTLAGFLYFTREEVDFTVIETGLGGRLDATNLIKPIVTVITTISYDHQDYLGNTLEKIAGEKAGIIKKGIPLFLMEQDPGVQTILIQRARELNAAVQVVPQQKSNYMQSNHELAVVVLNHLLPDMIREQVQQLEQLTVRLRARMQIVRTCPPVIIDAAHNREGVEALVARLKEHSSTWTFFFATTHRKEIFKLIDRLTTIAERVYLCEFDYFRAASKEDYKGVSSAGPKITILEREDVWPVIHDSIESRTAPVCITGSFYFIGEVLPLIEQQTVT